MRKSKKPEINIDKVNGDVTISQYQKHCISSHEINTVKNEKLAIGKKIIIIIGAIASILIDLFFSLMFETSTSNCHYVVLHDFILWLSSAGCLPKCLF